jgi:glutamate/tyrosine decarboxylase-like PLP-dependent enzyme
VCRERGLWFHVDAAYGGAAVLADDLRPLLAGVEQADSVTVDAHKWLYTPTSAGCLIVRDGELLGRSFAVSPSYVYEEADRTGRGVNPAFLGLEFSRDFRALKVWLSLLIHGSNAYGRRISHDVALARYLAAQIEERPDFELAAPPSLSICCFRYRPADLGPGSASADYLDRLNERLLTELQLDGRVFPSNAVIRGRFALRACIVNFRTEAGDLDRLLDVTAELGEALDRRLRTGAMHAAP